MSGWIKLHRKLLDNPVWLDCNASQKVILITILLKANHVSKTWIWNGKEFKAEPGQFITSLKSLADSSGTSIQSVRSSLKRFEKFKILTYEATKTGRLITVIKWAAYQQENITPNIEANKDPTKTQQRPNKDPTTNKNDKNYKNDKECKKKEKTYVETSDEVRLSLLLFSLLKVRDDKLEKPNIQSWAKNIDGLIRLDKRSPKEIEKVIRWCQADSFWQSNIRATLKLRKQFSRLLDASNKKQKTFTQKLSPQEQNEALKAERSKRYVTGSFGVNQSEPSISY